MRVHPACSILRQTVSALTHQRIPPASRTASTNQGCWASRPEGVRYLPSWLHQDARTSPCLGSGIPLPGISSSSRTTWSVANSQTEPGVALIKRDREHWPRVWAGLSLVLARPWQERYQPWSCWCGMLSSASLWRERWGGKAGGVIWCWPASGCWVTL